MDWLGQRLKDLNLTHQDLADRLAERGIERTRATISNWAKGRNITLLAIPTEAVILADALDWSVAQMLIKAGYPIVETTIEIPEELMPVIDQLRQMDIQRRTKAIQMLASTMDIWISTME